MVCVSSFVSTGAEVWDGSEPEGEVEEAELVEDEDEDVEMEEEVGERVVFEGLISGSDGTLC